MQAGRTALHLAALGGWSEAVYLLCRHGASVHARDQGGRTPLAFAASHGHWKAIEKLMSWGAESSTHMPVRTCLCMTVKLDLVRIMS